MQQLLRPLLSLLFWLWLVLLFSANSIRMVYGGGSRQTEETSSNKLGGSIRSSSQNICQDNLPDSKCQELVKADSSPSGKCSEVTGKQCRKTCNLCDEDTLPEQPPPLYRADGCVDKFPNCTSHSVSNPVTCCNWYNSGLSFMQFPCKKSCGVCGDDGALQPTQNQPQQRKPSAPASGSGSSYPSFVDNLCRPDYSKPIESQPTAAGSAIISQISG